MAGPWEEYQPAAAPPGPWTEFQAPVPAAPGPKEAQNIGDSIVAGLQDNSLGLAIRGELPDMVLGENAPWYMRLGAGVGAVVGDFVPGVVGAVAGAPGGPVGMMAGGFAAPMALRAALIEAYSNDYASSWEGVWEIAKAAVTGGAKGAVIGAATMGAGKVAAPLLKPLGKVTAGVGTFGAELGALTTTAAALEGQLPTWQNFMDNALLLGGMKGAVRTAKGIMGVWRDTGVDPTVIATNAKTDPALKAYLKGEAEDLPSPYKELALDERIKASVAADARPEQMRDILGAKEPPKLGELPIKDPVKYEYITDQDTLKGTLRLVESFYQPEIQTQTRGVVTNKATAAEALKMVAEGDVAEHVVGTAENAAQIYARAHVLKGVTQNAYNKVRALEGIPEADLTPRMKLESLAALEQLSMVLAEYRGARAEAGRALQVFNKIKRDSSFMGDAKMLIDMAERKGSFQDIAALVASLKDPAQMQKFAKQYEKATTTEMVLEGWKAAILSGPQTHLANMMGNSMKWIVELPENVVAATLTATQRAAAKDPLSMAQYKARAFAPLYGLQHGARDSLTVAAEVWKQKGEHLEKADVYKTAIPGKTGEVIRTSFRLLQIEDALFRTVAERAEAHIMAVDRVIKEGLHPETAEGRAAMVKYTETPELGLSAKAAEAAIQRVQQAGAEAVFAQRLGPRLELVQRAMAGHPIGFVVPFFRTPVNLVSWAIQHTPGMNFMSGRWRGDYAAGGERRSRALARVTIGAALSMTAFQMAQDGLITGGGSVDPEQRRTKAAAGWQQYSFLINGKYYSYQRMEPVAKVMGMAADLTEIMVATKDPEDKAKLASMLVLLFGNATISTTYMSGASNMMNGLLDPERYGESIMEQYASSLVPKIVGQTVAANDEYKREVDGVVDAIQSQLPYFREKLLPQRDVWGEPSKNQKWFAVMPVQVTEASKDKVKTEAVRLQIAIADAPKYVVEKGPFNPSDKRIELTGEQRDIMKEVTGKQAMFVLSGLVNSPDWKHTPEYAKAGIFKKVISDARVIGMLRAFPPDDAARVQKRQELVDELVRQQLEAAQQ